MNGTPPLIILVSFEGPDPYAMAGGLGQRVSTLAEALADMGMETHLFFVGDPDQPGEESRADGRLVLHRWAQWISRYYPAGVYAGEEDKRREVSASLPPALVQLVGRAVEAGRPCRLLFEDWQCAEAAGRTVDALAWAGLLRTGLVAVGHNTNTLMQIHRAGLSAIRDRLTLLTVSRFMKHALWAWEVNPVVVPNGIPDAAFRPPDADAVAWVEALKAAGRTVLVKVARFDPDKAWMVAVEAVHRLKLLGLRPLFVMRGGMENHAHDVMRRMDELGLRVRDLSAGASLPTPEEVAAVDVIHWRARIPEAMLRGLYASATVVLAQSGIEPFGLVGLEVMAQGGVVMTGATGEDYARHGYNAVVAETGRSDEVAYLVRAVADGRIPRARLVAGAKDTAERYRWSAIIPELLDRLQFFGGS